MIGWWSHFVYFPVRYIARQLRQRRLRFPFLKPLPRSVGQEERDLAPRIALVSPGQGEPHPHLVRVGVTGRRSRAPLSGMSETCSELLMAVGEWLAILIEVHRKRAWKRSHLPFSKYVLSFVFQLDYMLDIVW
ncbi:hypothetical protein CDAR_58261 [Caerostris darwini]|uniref:Uncharacterized protein n=1 Tax=Caerostris darwini TaxID=1538125 RepID=A0AAV4U740_9ARAC|nr:hypothetical protein CDAR_58261 [Caerostris darwini]